MQKSIFIIALVAFTSFFVACKADKAETKQPTTTTQAPPKESSISTEKESLPEVASLENANYTVDVTNSTITWTGSKPTGTHQGTLKLKGGTFVIDKNAITAGKAIIDMTTISNTDQSGGDKAKLEKHLKSPDFFAVAAHPTATIDITKVGVNSFGTTLTIKGIEKPINLTTAIKKDGDKYTVTLKPVEIDRTQWGIKYNSGKFFQNLADRLISDMIKVEGKIVLQPK